MTTNTTERPTDLDQSSGIQSAQPILGFAGVAVVALVLGLLGGWLIWGTDDDSSAGVADDGISAAVLSADGIELTEDHEQMVSMLDEYLNALRSGDYEAAAALFEGPGFTGSVVLENGFEILAPELATFLEDQMRMSEIFDVKVVSADTIVFFHRDGDEILADVVRFGDFSLGENWIEQHLIASA